MTDTAVVLDTLPGFRRRIVIDPQPGRCVVDLEDDYHRMTVIVAHAGGVATTIGCAMERVPWTICPGARSQLVRGFAGRRLAEFATTGAKTEHCTHLYDLTLLAGAHAGDAATTTIDILVSDPVAGLRHAELRRDGVVALAWSFGERRFATPVAIAGLTLYDLRGWIDGLDPAGQEAARLLRWGSMLAHGRTTDMTKQDDASLLPRGTCYTFQARRVPSAARNAETVRDFSVSGTALLADLHRVRHRRGVT